MKNSTLITFHSEFALILNWENAIEIATLLALMYFCHARKVSFSITPQLKNKILQFHLKRFLSVINQNIKSYFGLLYTVLDNVSNVINQNIYNEIMYIRNAKY